MKIVESIKNAQIFIVGDLLIKTYEEGFMYGSKTGWIFPIIVLITLIAIIWIGISQCKTNENLVAINYRVISIFVE
jgi:hypothetical protein